MISGTRGQICLNGAAARLVQAGDPVAIVSYAGVDKSEAETHER
ncbi:aspartate 1-decarboxylase [Breoghania sp.]|nr:aspartate 1-decarboxylase [Breoghania sp.]